MKIIRNKFFSLIAFALVGLVTLTGSTPPEPTAKMAAKPPPPPGEPIDENIFMLLIVALLFGIYSIHKNQLKAKNPT